MGHATEFTAFYSANRRRLIAALATQLGDRALAAEAVDEAMVRAYERWRRVGVLAEPAGWVFVTARNVARRRFRRQRRDTTLVSDPTPIAEPAGETWLLVQDLPPRQQEAVVLRHLAGLTERGVAEAMGITRGTVSSTLRDAYQTLAAQLGVDTENLVNEEVRG
jgi:RNA polymerase sigma-70 factor (ECF subfamily)